LEYSPGNHQSIHLLLNEEFQEIEEEKSVLVDLTIIIVPNPAKDISKYSGCEGLLVRIWIKSEINADWRDFQGMKRLEQ